MANVYNAPEISVTEVAQKRANKEPFILLDIRESAELMMSELGEGVEHLPLSSLVAMREQALPAAIIADKTVEIVVFCHHGSRSAQVTAWLLQQGWVNVLSMAGGIEAYAQEVDASVGFY